MKSLFTLLYNEHCIVNDEGKEAFAGDKIDFNPIGDPDYYLIEGFSDDGQRITFRRLRNPDYGATCYPVISIRKDWR